MKIIGVIPARFGSTRFPGKPLIKIAGKSLIQRVYLQAQKADLSKIIVATDDKRILDEVASFGGNAVLTGEHHTGTDRIGEVIQNEDFDAVINIQGDEPLIEPQIIDTIINSIKNYQWADMTTAAALIENNDEIDDPNIVKVVFSAAGKALYFSRSRIPFNRNPVQKYYKHIGIYAYRKNFIKKFISLQPSSLEKAESLEQLRALENGFAIHVSEVKYNGFGIDTPGDAETAERLLADSDG
ncbi:MAG: 3-deoxy-manno-octulosonate cytidylyltransferase [Spirochaetes bacterium]|nr:3-deoxy-manno-octulosonate cytidylyltransferase [Spirochaetota bacterium]